jgi:hypothetical protein
MANLLEIANLAWDQLYPEGTDETPISFEAFLATAKGEYAYQFLLWYWKEKRDEGVFNIPGDLSTQSEPLPVVDDAIDISHLEILSRLPDDRWLQNIGGLTCGCRYVKSNINQSQLLCDDDSMGDNFKTYLIVGTKIIFPKGTHADKLPIIYANSGKDVDGNIEVSDAIGGIVRTRLIEIYGGKTGKEDKTNNSDGDT